MLEKMPQPQEAGVEKKLSELDQLEADLTSLVKEINEQQQFLDQVSNDPSLDSVMRAKIVGDAQSKITASQERKGKLVARKINLLQRRDDKYNVEYAPPTKDAWQDAAGSDRNLRQGNF